MKSTAYVVVTFDCITGIPTFVCAGIFSEPTPTADMRYKHFVAFESIGRTYAEARARAIETIQTSPKSAHGWLAPILTLVDS